MEEGVQCSDKGLDCYLIDFNRTELVNTTSLWETDWCKFFTLEDVGAGVSSSNGAHVGHASVNLHNGIHDLGQQQEEGQGEQLRQHFRHDEILLPPSSGNAYSSTVLSAFSPHCPFGVMVPT